MKATNREKFLDALQKHPLFEATPPEALPDFLKGFEEERWPKHTVNLSSAKTLQRFHIIISGRVKIYKINPTNGREFTLFLLTRNDVFDILCLLDENEHLVFYEALDDVVVLSTPIEKMRDWVRDHPEINRRLLPYLAKQMRILEEHASNISLIDVSTRLAKLILNNINSTSHKLELINDLSNEEIAKLIGSTRAVVNRHLQQFKNDGILKMSRKKVEIQNLELLLQKAEKRHL